MGAEHDRHRELLAEDVLFGLEDQEQGELLESGKIPGETLALELTAAAMLRHLVEAEGIDEPPAHLRTRLSTDAFQWLSTHDRAGQGPGAAPFGRSLHAVPPIAQPAAEGFRLLMLAAAVLVVTTLAIRSMVTGEPSAADQRETLIAAAVEQQLLRLPWADGSDAPGEVVWHQERQEGYLTFDGLPVNNPEEYQYQLWIFDGDVPASQVDEDGVPLYPVDGGVFDISADGTVVIPIDAKIAVRKAVAFAVTRERPGGVVRSERKDIATITPL